MQNHTQKQINSPILLVSVTNTMFFGEKLYQWRKAKGLTQQELAEAAGIGVAYVSNLERDFSTFLFNHKISFAKHKKPVSLV